MRRVAFDIETNGLLDELHTLHSIVLMDLDSECMLSCAYQDGYSSPGVALEILAKADLVCGHNIKAFDIPALQKLYPWFKVRGDVYDTLVAARTAYPDLMPFDATSELPTKEWGSHSLKAWGMRTGTYKTQYDLGFENWSETMQRYCEDDVRATKALYQFLQEEKLPREALAIEHTLADYIIAQERNGFPFDVPKALELKTQLEKDLEEALQALKTNYFKMWVEAGEVKIPIRNYGKLKDLLGPKTDVFTKAAGAAYQEIEIKEFTGGPQQIKKCLKRFYGWQPDYIKKRKRVKDDFENVIEEEGTDTDTLSKLEFDCIPDLLKYKQAQKVLGMLSEGQNAWLKLVKEDGCIHGRVIQNGTITHRARHSKPNISQVPSAGKPYGKECRNLFYAPEGWTMVGTDASGLELRMLAHYMHKYDGGAYGAEILTGDIHTVNQHAAGLETRPQAKSFIYAYLYGAGAVKLGSIVCPNGTEDVQKQIGERLRKKFLNSLPALDMVISEVTRQAERNDYVISLDGRKTYVKSAHKALNCLLQSSGSILVKKWICLFYAQLVEQFGEPRWDGLWTPCSYSHDDVLLCVRNGYVEQVQQVLLDNIREAGKQLGVKIQMDGESKVGTTWYDVH